MLRQPTPLDQDRPPGTRKRHHLWQSSALSNEHNSHVAVRFESSRVAEVCRRHAAINILTFGIIG